MEVIGKVCFIRSMPIIYEIDFGELYLGVIIHKLGLLFV